MTQPRLSTQSKKFSQPLNKPRESEAHLSFAEALETTLQRELEAQLAQQRGLGEDLRAVRHVFQVFIREHAQFRGLLTRILGFYEETSARLLREVEHLRTQLSRAQEDRTTLEATLRKLVPTVPAVAPPPVQHIVGRQLTAAPVQPPERPAKPTKVFTRPRSVPRLNLEILRKPLEADRRLQVQDL